MNLQDEVWDFMKEARYRIAFALLMIGVTGVLLWEDFVSIYIVLAFYIGSWFGSIVTHSFYSKAQLDVDTED